MQKQKVDERSSEYSCSTTKYSDFVSSYSDLLLPNIHVHSNYPALFDFANRHLVNGFYNRVDLHLTYYSASVSVSLHLLLEVHLYFRPSDVFILDQPASATSDNSAMPEPTDVDR